MGERRVRIGIIAMGLLAAVALGAPASASAQTGGLRPPLQGGQSMGGCGYAEGDKRPDCSGAYRAERDLHQRELLAINNARIDASTEYKVGVKNCGSDNECKRREHDKQKERLRDIDSRRIVENARHKKQTNAIQAMERHLRERLRAE
jgi:hypothetical protein